MCFSVNVKARHKKRHTFTLYSDKVTGTLNNRHVSINFFFY